MKRHILLLNLYSLFIVLVIAAVLRFYCLSCSSLWHDEGNTWALMARSFADIATDWYRESDAEGRITFLSEGIAQLGLTPAALDRGEGADFPAAVDGSSRSSTWLSSDSS